MGIIAFTLVILNIVVMTYLQSSIETNYLGRVMSTLFTLNTSIMPIGTIVFTYLFQKGHKRRSYIHIWRCFSPDLYRDNVTSNI